MTSGGVTVKGLRELQATFALAGREASGRLRSELRAVAEPVRADAQSFASESIRRIGPTWSQMRTGVTRRSVYVAPKQRGVKARGNDPRRRPNLAGLLMRRAMQPALDRHQAEIATRAEAAFERLANEFNRRP